MAIIAKRRWQPRHRVPGHLHWTWAQGSVDRDAAPCGTIMPPTHFVKSPGIEHQLKRLRLRMNKRPRMRTVALTNDSQGTNLELQIERYRIQHEAIVIGDLQLLMLSLS